MSVDLVLEFYSYVLLSIGGQPRAIDCLEDVILVRVPPREVLGRPAAASSPRVYERPPARVDVLYARSPVLVGFGVQLGDDLGGGGLDLAVPVVLGDGLAGVAPPSDRFPK